MESPPLTKNATSVRNTARLENKIPSLPTGHTGAYIDFIGRISNRRPFICFNAVVRNILMFDKSNTLVN